jgi:hypothetical protein
MIDDPRLAGAITNQSGAKVPLTPRGIVEPARLTVCGSLDDVEDFPIAGLDQRCHLLVVRLKILVTEERGALASNVPKFGTVSSSTSV